MERVAEALGEHLNPWGYVLLFLLTALEASAFVGLFIPGEAALLFAGFLAYDGRLELLPVIAIVIVGGVIGDSLGYELGRHLGWRLKRGRLGRLVGQERWDRGRAYIRMKGGRAVLLGRFFGLLRAVVPAVAGDARMPYRTFLALNVAGALIWAPSAVIAGYIAGSSYRTVEEHVGRASVALAPAAIAVFLVIHILHKRRHEREEEVAEQDVSEDQEPAAVDE